jgi:hypothetical protein
MRQFSAAILMFLAGPTALAEGIPDGTKIREDRACYTIFSGAWGHGKKLGVTWQSIAHTREDGRNVLDIVVHQKANNDAFDMRDHFVLDGSTLLPIRLETIRNGKPHAFLEYRNGRVIGWHFGKDATRHDVDISLPGPVWDGNLYGPTFAALELKAGGQFAVPFYQYDRGLGQFSVAVTATERVTTPEGNVDAWVVHAGPNPAEMLDYLIGRESRRELGYRAAEGYQLLGGDCTGIN